ncbi:hypothetical protein GCM10010532_040520 [Dactylosporangium siamense]
MAERYQAGERRQVWDELVALGPAAYDDRWHADATAVAEATMQRVAANIATVVERLNRMDYRFAVQYLRNQRAEEVRSGAYERRRARMVALGLDPSLIKEPVVEDDLNQFHYRWQPRQGARGEGIERAERICGPLPISLRAMWSIVGDVALLGSFRSWVPSAFVFEDEIPWPAPGRHSAPLDLSDEEAIFAYCVPGTDEIGSRYRDAAGRFGVTVGADEIHGAGYSGGVHQVRIPDAVADPVVDGVWGHEGIRLVEYLRLCFEWGGFPGFAEEDDVPAEIAVLREGLLAI